MVLETQFHGVVFITPLSKLANNFRVTMYFHDEGSIYKGYNAKIGDYVYTRVQTGKFHRLKVTDIESKDTSTIVAILTDEDATIRGNLIAYNGVIMRETPNMKLPLFSSGVSMVLLAAIKTHLALLIDKNTQGSDCKSTITAAELDGTEFISIIKNGESRCLPISEAIEYWLTLKSPNGARKRLTLTDYAQTEWENRPPQ